MDQKILNMAEMIGCNKKQFFDIICKSSGNITMSSGSWYSPFYLFDDTGLLAKYDSKGGLLFNR